MTRPTPSGRHDDRDPRPAPDVQDPRRHGRGGPRRRPDGRGRARSSASSGPTAPARRRRCGCSRRCSTPTGGRGDGRRRRPRPRARSSSAERIGYVPQGGSTDPAETGRGELVIQGRLYGMNKAEATRRAAEVLEALDLEAAADRTTGTYSGGMRRRLDIGLGIVHRPARPVPRRADDRPRPAGARPHVGRDPDAPRAAARRSS